MGNDYLKDFSEVLFNPDDLIEIRFISGVKGALKPESDWLFAEDLPDYHKIMQERNEAGYGIFCGVLPRRGHKTEDVDCLDGSVLWADFDKMAKKDAIGIIKKSKMPQPTMIVDSGHGIHAYWRLQEKQTPDLLSALVYDTADMLDIDRTVRNPSRIMRIPGYANTKEGARDETKIKRLWKDNIYDFSSIRAIVPENEYRAPERDFEEIPVGRVSRDRQELIRQATAYTATITATSGNRDHTAYRVAAILHTDFDLMPHEAGDVLREWNISNCSPSLTENELKKVFHNSANYAKGEKRSKIREEDSETRRKKAKKKRSKKKDSSIGRETYREIKQEILGGRSVIQTPQWPILNDNAPIMLPGKMGIITGMPGTCKSYFALALGVTAERAGYSWKYLPLEDTRSYHTRRLVAHITGDWELATHFSTLPLRKQNHMLQKIKKVYMRFIEKYGQRVEENPALQGDSYEEVTAEDVLEWAEEESEAGTRLLLIDPLAQIEFGGREEWRQQASFTRELIGIANRYANNIFLVVHLSKKGDSGLYGVEGSKRLVDLGHTVLRIETAGKEEEISTPGGLIRRKPNRHIRISKCREGKLDEKTLAFMFGEYGPSWREVGIVGNTDFFSHIGF